MAFIKNLGYTTINKKFETLTNKDLAKHDLLMQLFTDKGECDWNPNFGTNIRKLLFQPKTVHNKEVIISDIENVFDSEPRFTLQDIQVVDIEDGWEFHTTVSYLDGTPEEWVFNITKEMVSNYSNGYYKI